MKRGRGTASLVLGVALAIGTSARAQEPAVRFDALADRLTRGETIWVTDLAGREVRGRLAGVSTDELTLDGPTPRRFSADDVQRIRRRDRDPLKNGTLVGLAIGAGLGTAWCIGAVADDSGDLDARVECAEGFTVFPGLGALAGLVVDAVVPGRMRIVYRAPPAARRGTGARVTITPSAAAGRRGVRVSLTF
jgi:hypothetical protein